MLERSAPKAWRFVSEMGEIAATFEALGLPGGFHHAAERFLSPLAPGLIGTEHTTKLAGFAVKRGALLDQRVDLGAYLSESLGLGGLTLLEALLIIRQRFLEWFEETFNGLLTLTKVSARALLQSSKGLGREIFKGGLPAVLSLSQEILLAGEIFLQFGQASFCNRALEALFLCGAAAVPGGQAPGKNCTHDKTREEKQDSGGHHVQI